MTTTTKAPVPSADPPSGWSEFFDAVRKGVLIGAGVLVLVLPPLKMMQGERRAEQQVQSPPVATAPATPPSTAPTVPQATAPAAPAVPAVPAQPRLADFGDKKPSPDVRLVANWAVYTRDHGARSFVVVDKKLARVYVFDPQGKLKAETPALLGSAIGDHTVPGIGNKPLSQVKPDEKTTPAGRFIAEPGMNLSGEDVVWVDYDAAVSMHRIRPHLNPAERRAQRMASPTHKDNRISFGCINLPVAFYEKVLSPTVKRTGAVVYVLPEIKTPQQVFGAWDVTQPMTLAQKQ